MYTQFKNYFRNTHFAVIYDVTHEILHLTLTVVLTAIRYDDHCAIERPLLNYLFAILDHLDTCYPDFIRLS